jgi:hypothetical protein
MRQPTVKVQSPNCLRKFKEAPQLHHRIVPPNFLQETQWHTGGPLFHRHHEVFRLDWARLTSVGAWQDVRIDPHALALRRQTAL